MAGIRPFHVMALLQRARELEARGRSIIHMEIGEPDFPAPAQVVDAGIDALRAGHTRYTPALGIAELRAAIAASYPASIRPDPRRVIVTPGASGALQLAFGVTLDGGDEVLMADPGYPCNRHFVRLFGGEPRLIPVGPQTDYQLTAELVARHWGPRTRVVMVSTPANPTGTIVPDEELAHIAEVVREREGVIVCDEIYQRLTYDAQPPSVLHHFDQALVVNGFSKYQGMTGWRIGWLVAPESLVEAVDRLAQNIFLAASTPAQYAALATFTPGVEEELQRRRGIFRQRRDYLVPALRGLGFQVPVVPQGAFYVYADCSALCADSFEFVNDLLERRGVAITPGLDFGEHRAKGHVRISYATSIENLKEAIERLGSR